MSYPLVTAGAYSVTPGDGTAHLGLVLNLFDPPACTKGYRPPETYRPGNDTTPREPYKDAYCAEPPGSPIAVRGSQNAPVQRRAVAADARPVEDANRNRDSEQLEIPAAHSVRLGEGGRTFPISACASSSDCRTEERRADRPAHADHTHDLIRSPMSSEDQRPEPDDAEDRPATEPDIDTADESSAEGRWADGSGADGPDDSDASENGENEGKRRGRGGCEEPEGRQDGQLEGHGRRTASDPFGATAPAVVHRGRTRVGRTRRRYRVRCHVAERGGQR